MKRRLPLALALAALIMIPLSACSALSGTSGGSDTMRGEPSARSEADPGVSGGEAGDMAAPSVDDTPESRAERSVIRTGDLALEVDDPADAAERVAEVAEQQGGSVQSSNVYRASGEVAAGADVTLRVPEDRIDETFDALSEVGTVLSQSRSELDVTTEHVDLRARVAALESSVERLTELMAGAATTSELLEAEAALSQRQQDLDGLRAQLKSLEGQVSEATIDVSLRTRSALPGGGPSNFWEGLLAGIGSLGTAGAGALVLAGILLPWLAVAAVLAVAVLLIVRAAHRRRSRKADTAPAAPAAAAPAPAARTASGPDQRTDHPPASAASSSEP
ncbi:DUF4349 domain-containing protein [Leucobacter tenebrionis]|uniref:DUF4349 domain-containing protein n=1 Tax=Leucobacter tenebrionis TaxID=2873270 RepID=UPI001CA631F4|nr:DUF4349 domain-containing protein [Leucobacter tenebrionis]QZY51726.1 DUF4349 domain-containing protein [Leucobacter tenebrionis]